MVRFRRPLVAVVVGAAAVVPLALTLGPAHAAKKPAKKPPVELDGKVENEGVGKVKNGRVRVRADDFAFEKTFLKAQPGTVEVTVVNVGNAPHTFTIDDQDIDEELEAGDRATVQVEVAEGEPVVFYCRFHEGTGMQGAFFVKKGAAATPSTRDSGGGSLYGY